MFIVPPHIPNTFRSHIITTIITTIFKMDLIDEAIGMKRLMSQSIRPTTTKVIITVIKGVMVKSF